jgi:hypothetical protein
MHHANPRGQFVNLGESALTMLAPMPRIRMQVRKRPPLPNPSLEPMN